MGLAKGVTTNTTTTNRQTKWDTTKCVGSSSSSSSSSSSCFGFRTTRRRNNSTATTARRGGERATTPLVVPRAKDLGSKSTLPLTYSGAGVDIDAASDLVRRIQKMNPEIGGFGGLFPIGNDQYLVAGTDGVGTKLKLAFDMDQHSTIGTDLVAMSVNDIITLGAKPLFFLDYFATSKLDVDQAEQVVRGIVEGCKASDCILLGGETAEMPGFYGEGEYDLSGFAVGIVQKKDLIDGKDIAAGDVLVGLPSSGVHSNGYSLVRQVLARSGLGLQDPFPLDPTRTVGEVLLVPTELYARDLLRVADVAKVKGAVHVTGGGFQDNIPRVLPQGLGVQVYRDSWEVLPVFQWMQEVGSIEFEEMYRTFNMGIGFIMVMAEKDAKKALEECPAAKIIGQVVQEQGVAFT